jgi:hypothetical protein
MRRCLFHVYRTNTTNILNVQLKIMRLYEEALYISYYGPMELNYIIINASLNGSDGGVLVFVIILLDFSYLPIL